MVLFYMFFKNLISISACRFSNAIPATSDGEPEMANSERGKEGDTEGTEFFLVCWWFGTWLLFSHILGMIFPTDLHIFQWGRSTTNQLINKPLLMFFFFCWVFLNKPHGLMVLNYQAKCLQGCPWRMLWKCPWNQPEAPRKAAGKVLMK